MKIGLSAYDLTAPDVAALAVAAEAAGFDSLWLGEHVVHPVGYATSHPVAAAIDATHITGPIISPTTELVDPLVALGAAAAVTRRIELATGIFIVPLRHPLAIARSTCTVQDLAGGRFVLGVGVGWLEDEFAALDVPFGERVGRFEESLELLRSAWQGGPIRHTGRHFTVADVQVTARPISVPLILGGNGDAALARAVRLGDGWFASGTPTIEAASELNRKVRALHAAGPRAAEDFRIIVRVADADPATIERYAERGFDEVLVWADQVWDLDAPAGERTERLTAAAGALRRAAGRPA